MHKYVNLKELKMCYKETWPKILLQVSLNLFEITWTDSHKNIVLIKYININCKGADHFWNLCILKENAEGTFFFLLPWTFKKIMHYYIFELNISVITCSFYILILSRVPNISRRHSARSLSVDQALYRCNLLFFFFNSGSDSSGDALLCGLYPRYVWQEATVNRLDF